MVAIAGMLAVGSTLAQAAGTFALAYVFGYALTVGPLMQEGEGFWTAFTDAFYSETPSITIMEITAIGTYLPSAGGAKFGEFPFWGLSGLLALGRVPVRLPGERRARSVRRQRGDDEPEEDGRGKHAFRRLNAGQRSLRRSRSLVQLLLRDVAAGVRHPQFGERRVGPGLTGAEDSIGEVAQHDEEAERDEHDEPPPHGPSRRIPGRIGRPSSTRRSWEMRTASSPSGTTGGRYR